MFVRQVGGPWSARTGSENGEGAARFGRRGPGRAKKMEARKETSRAEPRLQLSGVPRGPTGPGP